MGLWIAEWVIDSYERNTHTAVVEKIIEVLKVSKETDFRLGKACIAIAN